MAPVTIRIEPLAPLTSAREGDAPDLVDLHELAAAAREYGEPLPASLVATERAQGTRERFAALFGSRVGE